MRNSCYYFLTIILSIPLFFPQSLSAQSATTRLDRAIASIDYDYFFKHLSYLASDELKGRGIGTQEYDMAARYVADEFRKNGLESFGDAGTYFQQVALSKLSISKRNFSLQFNNESKTIGAEYGSNLSVVLSPAHQEINEEQQVVFVGYGNIVPEQNINDYEGVDVKGKTVIVALGGPKGMSHPSFHDRNEKFKNAVANGASGLILFYPKADLLQNVIFRKVHGFLSKGMLAIADTSMQNPIGNADLRLLFFAKKQLVENIFKLNGLILKQTLQNMAKGTYESKALTSTIQCQYTVKSEPMESKNVMAILPGTDPHLRNEYVVIGAHLDGSGIGKAIKGDSIYNGMMDNASGVSALLSISKAFNKLEVNPKRSIIFACYTAEENGLLGSSYFTNRNNISNGRIVANINIDMLAQTIETADMAPLGYGHSNLSEAADFAAHQLELKIDDNTEAELTYIERSDQVSFLKKEVPVLFIAAGFTAADPPKNGEKTFNKWMKKTYHSPFDDLNQEYSDKAFLSAIRFDFLTTYYIANLLEEIKWNADSWLYKKYVKTGNSPLPE